ncbi:MAG: Txe/YoeB family addiction module toxin [Mucispirillum sp.]|nr:Txe/YoeB family addiction module toxin [Mucispirillum sp.]
MSKLDTKAKALIEIIRKNPYLTPPPFEKLQGDLQSVYSRRINIKHRLVYEVLEETKTVKIISMRSRYEFLPCSLFAVIIAPIFSAA